MAEKNDMNHEWLICLIFNSVDINLVYLEC